MFRMVFIKIIRLGFSVTTKKTGILIPQFHSNSLIQIPGSCPRIMVDVRHNGTNLRLEECESIDTIWCHGIDPNMKLNE